MAAVVYFIIGIVFAGFMALSIIFARPNPAPAQEPPGWGFVMAAGWVGGIEMTVEERREG